MGTRTVHLVRGAVAALLVAGAMPVSADITGTIDATITLVSGCEVNGDNQADGAAGADFGLLDFEEQTTLFDTADAQVAGAAGGIEVQCTAGVTPRVVFGAGENDGQGTGPGNRAMRNGSQYVTYQLYRDPGLTQSLDIGDGITLEDDGSEQNVSVYARAWGAAGLQPGEYTDIITVVLEL